MHAKWWCTTFLIFLFIPRIAHASVSVTEVAWMGTAESSYCEWVELYNDGGDPVSLAGWELDEAGGSTKIISLSKTIGASAYFVVERVTPSCPDPVPGVSGESGSFGGSGLSNDGESIVLKDADGAKVQTLDFASGWPAGDGDSKETMQRDGDGWKTAAPTPGAAYGGDQDDTEDVDAAAKSESGDGQQKKIPTYTPHIDFSVAPQVYAGVENEYDATVTIEHGQSTAGYFVWNFGDGTVVRETGLTPALHTYTYPGTYTLTLSYYPSGEWYGTPKPSLQGIKTIRVNASSIELRNLGGGWIELKNNLDAPVDVSGWKLSLDGDSAAFPEFSIVAPKATITLSLATFNLPKAGQTIALLTPSGMPVVAIGPAPQSVKGAAHTVLPARVQSEQSASIIQTLAAVEQPGIGVSEKALPAAGKRNSAIQWVYGAALITIIGLFVLLERTMAKRE